MIGVNLAGGEFGGLPGAFGKDYTYPGAPQFDFCRAKGLTVVRLPFKWERVQPVLMGPLDDVELGRLDGVVSLARERGIKILLDVHNYARYRGQVIGTAEVPHAAFADFWRKLAGHYRDETTIFAYGMMNEPHGTGGRWPAAAQVAVNAIRSVDTRHTISVCGDGWSGAHSCKKVNNALVLNDPASNLVYEAHEYFDRDRSGSYKQGFDDSGAGPDTGVERLQPFLEWLREHHARGFIGEFGVPGDDLRWLETMDRFLAAMKTHGLGGTYWAAGPWWGDYPLSVEPRDGEDRPQMEALALFAGSRTRPAGVKTSYDGAAARVASLPKAARKSPPPGSTKVIHDFGSRAESYHYSNDGSEFSSRVVSDGGRKARRIDFRHKGNPAWVGLGVYLGGRDVHGYSALRLGVRAEKPTHLEVKVYPSDDRKFSARYEVGVEWKDLTIPFSDLRGADAAYDTSRPLLKLEFQPDADFTGSALLLDDLELVAP